MIGFAIFWALMLFILFRRESISTKEIVLRETDMLLPATVAQGRNCSVAYNEVRRVTLQPTGEDGPHLYVKSDIGLLLFDSRDFESEAKFFEFEFHLRRRVGVRKT